MAISDKIDGPYVDHPGNPLISFKELNRDIEDPYAFFYKDSYYMIVEDRMSIADTLSGEGINFEIFEMYFENFQKICF